MKKQLELNLDEGNWGGRRKNAGRKRKHSRGVAHETREVVHAKTPVHVNFKVRMQVRNKDGLKALRKAIHNARKFIAIIHYSLQSNHVHLIIEAKDNDSLSSGMRSLTITFSKLLKRGRIQLERYHLHVLRSQRETRNAMKYVILNQIRHSKRKVMSADLYSSLHLLPIKEMAKRFRISIIRKRLSDPFELDQPAAWFTQRGLKPT